MLFRVDLQDATGTTELQDSINNLGNTTVLIKSGHMLLARLYQFVCYTILVGGHFPRKSNDDCLPWLLYKSFFMLLSNRARERTVSGPWFRDVWLGYTQYYSGYGAGVTACSRIFSHTYLKKNQHI